MHFRKDHYESDIPTLRQFIKANPLGLLTTAIKSPSGKWPLLQSTHIPFLIDFDKSQDADLGRLRGHMARQNEQSKAIVEVLQDSGDEAILEEEVIVVFSSSAHGYISPRFYVETMAGNKRTAPTWDYIAVQAYGKARFYHSSKSTETIDFLMKQLGDLASFGEETIGHTGANGASVPWMISEAPTSYIETLRKNIIGIEIEITRLDGRFKLSQELKTADRDGVIQGLSQQEGAWNQEMIRLIQERAVPK